MSNVLLYEPELLFLSRLSIVQREPSFLNNDDG